MQCDFLCFKNKKGSKTDEEDDDEEDEKNEVNILLEQLFDNKYDSINENYRITSVTETHLHTITGLSTWTFDPLTILKTPNRISIFVEIFMFAMKETGLLTILRLSLDNLEAFAKNVAQIYHDTYNPYHNMSHAIHVFHSTCMFLKLPEIRTIVVTNPEIAFIVYIAALCHDIDHCGSTNRFLIATNNLKAVKYNGVSPQEMHHASVTLNLIEKHNVLEGSVVNAKMFKENIVNIILSTNIANHNKIIKSFSTNSPLKCMKLLVKCADLSHIFASEDNHMKWVSMLQEEFYIQGDREKYYGLPVTTMFDRDNPEHFALTQAYFFKIIVFPMFKLLFDMFPSVLTTTPIKDMMNKNYDQWTQKSNTHSSAILPKTNNSMDLDHSRSISQLKLEGYLNTFRSGA
jgi:3'5'-cyclic nucleotide phosphodiesterase